ncbi:MAG: alanine racemase, partial [Gammaproteobacteria bacterium]|nr:alanine racemase [Gammaproteobacteria bacterium]
MSQTAVAFINSNAIRQNFQKLKEHAIGCKVMPVLKANAYGHGMVQVAKLLSGADAFAVARVGEGAKLRSAGITQRLLVLGGCIDQVELVQALEHQLDLVVHDQSQLDLLACYMGGRRVNVWVKIDTGMGRLGFSPDKLSDVLHSLELCTAVDAVVCVMTHLACADEVENQMTLKQLQRFNVALQAAESSFLKYSGGISIANSAGILQWPQLLQASADLFYSGDNWVRPGLALYGVSPFDDKSSADFGLMPAMTFQSRLIAVKLLHAGDSVGYGADWVATTDMVIGIVAVGYGDGYPRCAAKHATALLNGSRVKLVGRVSMDMIALDLSALPDAKVGDAVELWGEHLEIQEVAHAAGTISYE